MANPWPKSLNTLGKRLLPIHPVPTHPNPQVLCWIFQQALGLDCWRQDIQNAEVYSHNFGIIIFALNEYLPETLQVKQQKGENLMNASLETSLSNIAKVALKITHPA